jgi:aspartyl-tRNA(Asn)/glutamyl-tRNA(Gln) amidotransferase subunit B
MVKSLPDAAGIAPEVLAKYEPVIGLEVHVQLLTKSKIFCGCSTRFGDAPNSNVCPVCLGLPGTLPVLNKRVVEMATLASLALNCTAHEHSRFARKNYFYPDLPKGYQISQYELPLATGGWIDVEHGRTKKRIGITRLHLEEDAAKNLHEGFSQSATKAYIDYNRCGTPLCEIVSEPDMRDMRAPEEAYAYLTTLRQILLYTGVSDCNMEEGSLRCDANVSVRLRGSQEFGTKVEVKNLNSFRFLQKALEYEIARHVGVLESGGHISQETRLWNQTANRTDSMRSKEKAHDYRYFPEPDLLPVHVSRDWLEEIRRTLPELPDAKRARFVTAYGITPYDAGVLTETEALADYFEDAGRLAGDPKKVANVVANWVLAELKQRGLTIEEWAKIVPPSQIARIVALQSTHGPSGSVTISTSTARALLGKMAETKGSADELIAAEGLAQISDTSAIEQVAREVIAKNPENVAKYKAGNEGVFKFFVGQVMRATRGQADPQLVNEIVETLTRLLGPVGMLEREKYEDILQGLRQMRNWTVHLGLRDTVGRFSQYEDNIQALIRVRESPKLNEFVKEKTNLVLIWSLVESMELADFSRTLRGVDQAILSERLKRALKGPILPTQEDAATTDARNTAFELAFASFLSSAGFEVQLPKQSEADIDARIGDTRFVIECKRLLSEKRLEERLSDASKQLSGFLDANEDAKGLIAVDVTKLKNLGEKVYEAQNAVAAKKGLGDLLENMLRENLNSLKRIKEKRIVGLLFYIHTPTFLREESLLTAAKQLALWPLCPPGTPEMKALQIFAAKVTDRVEHPRSKLEEA